MEEFVMKRATLIVCVLFLAVGLAYAKDYEITKKAGDYTVKVMIDKNPPITGNNNMVIELKNGASKDVTGATVVIDYGMPAMPGMPAMNYKTSAIPHGTAYHAVLNFSMSGAWSVGVKITKDGKTQTVKLNVDVK
jgi:hypothetical protein